MSITPGGRIVNVMTKNQVKNVWKLLWKVNALSKGSRSIPDVCTQVDYYKHLHISDRESTPEEILKGVSEIGEDRFVVYCAHEKCGAALRLFDKLVDSGLKQEYGYYMPCGLQEWITESPVSKES